MLNPQALSALPKGVRCRPADAADTGFLRHLHAYTRAQDLALLDVAPALLDALLSMQFEAQGRHHRQQHPGSMPWVIERHGQALGQITMHGPSIFTCWRTTRSGIGMPDWALPSRPKPASIKP
jgi:hypothetical protein